MRNTPYGYTQCSNRSPLVHLKMGTADSKESLFLFTGRPSSCHLRQNRIPLHTVVTGPFPLAVRYEPNLS
jgi:hypothetical protein